VGKRRGEPPDDPSTEFSLTPEAYDIFGFGKARTRVFSEVIQSSRRKAFLSVGVTKYGRGVPGPKANWRSRR